jgi:histidinol-phosphate phosphatase family protein
MNPDFLQQLTPAWTLFLDRDGVINERPINDYVRKVQDFKFLPGVLQALKKLAQVFERIVVVTNQQGIGKGLMGVEDVNRIHQFMSESIDAAGGRIDAVYFCPDLADKANNCRKPGIKMAEWARKEFPEIDFGKSVMIGDTDSDMAFGRHLGMYNTLITNEIQHPLADACFISLADFVEKLFSN